MLSRHEQHLSALSNRCFELVKEQTNKQFLSISVLIGSYTLVFGYLSGRSDYRSFDYSLLIILFLLGIGIDFFLIDITALQSGYKAEYQVISKIVMSARAPYPAKQIKIDLEKHRADQIEKYKFRLIRTTHIFILILLLSTWIPMVSLIIILNWFSLSVICGLCIATILYTCLMFIYLRKQMIYRVGGKKQSKSKRHFWVIDF